MDSVVPGAARVIVGVSGLPASLADRRCPTPILRGGPGRVLTESVSEPGDLLVIGTGRRGRLARIRHGKVSRYCVAHARCPVLSVPHPATATQMGLGPATRAQRYRDLTVNRAMRDWNAAA